MSALEIPPISEIGWHGALKYFSSVPGLSDVIINSSGRIRLKIRGAYRAYPIGDEMDMKQGWDELCALLNPDGPILGENEFSKEGGVIVGSVRFRYSRVRSYEGEEFTLRTLPSKIPTPSEIHFPGNIVQKFCEMRDGLVVIAGTTGNGKSTTIASLLAENARRRPVRIVTVEDPVEFLHPEQPNGSTFTYRSVGTHVSCFSAGVREALRMHPDIILIGEIRDSQTASVVIEAALSGHKVVTTIHGGSIEEGLQRLGDFALEVGQSALSGFAQAFRMGVAQRLEPSAKEEGGLLPLHEILIGVPAVKRKIRDGRFFTLRQEIEAGSEHGMQTFERSTQFRSVHLRGQN